MINYPIQIATTFCLHATSGQERDIIKKHFNDRILTKPLENFIIMKTS